MNNKQMITLSVANFRLKRQAAVGTYLMVLLLTFDSVSLIPPGPNGQPNPTNQPLNQKTDMISTGAYFESLMRSDNNYMSFFQGYKLVSEMSLPRKMGLLSI